MQFLYKCIGCEHRSMYIKRHFPQHDTVISLQLKRMYRIQQNSNALTAQYITVLRERSTGSIHKKSESTHN